MLSAEQKQIRRKRFVEFVADKPGALLVMLYAAAFLGVNMAMDFLTMILPSVDASVFRKYGLPVVGD